VPAVSKVRGELDCGCGAFCARRARVALLATRWMPIIPERDGTSATATPEPCDDAFGSTPLG
jgi:hypothetical protein